MDCNGQSVNSEISMEFEYLEASTLVWILDSTAGADSEDTCRVKGNDGGVGLPHPIGLESRPIHCHDLEYARRQLQHMNWK